MRRRLKRAALPWAGVVALAALGAATEASQAAPEQARPFGGTYSELSDVQRTLIDDIVARFCRITGREVSPAEVYDGARLSVRTTFEAVSHALSRSTLTDPETGSTLGRPIDLIDHLERVEGRVKGRGGDRQFRLYVALAPGALETLERSREFRRTADNTIFHKGYPISFRQEGGYPSIQFSVSRDGARADIDVDYRSSKFPNALFNGHLTSANSDVRAGNHRRHDGRWSGLPNWWEGFFERLFSPDPYAGETDQVGELARLPRKGKSRIDLAVHDFLSSWLVERRPDLAVAYVDREAYDCLALRLQEEGQSLDRGLAPLQLFLRMKALGDELGPRKSLADAVVGVRVWNPNLKLVRQPDHAQFVLYGVPRLFAESMRCGNYTKLGELPKDLQTPRIGGRPPESYLSAFSLVTDGPTGTLELLWEKRDGYWKIVSYEADVEADPEAGGLPEIGEQPETESPPKAEADKALIAANQRFLEAWLVEKDYDQALGYVSPRSYACVNLALDPGQPPIEDPDSQRQRLLLAMRQVGEKVGRVESLEAVVDGVEPWDPQVRIIEHPEQEAFSLFALPDWIGRQAGCEARLERADTPAVPDESRGYGSYYATALRFDTLAGESPALLLGWDRKDGDWKVFAYKVVEP